MKSQLITETVSTSEDSQKKISPAADSSTAPERAPARGPGVLLAGLILWAALSTAASAGTLPPELYLRRREDVSAESSTSETECDPELAKQVETVFRQGAAEFFQDGMYSQFSRSLLAILNRHGRSALRAIAEYVFSGTGNPEVISEALRWVADLADPATLPQRWAILQRTLQDSSPRIRDGAILGFAALDDPRARALLLDSQRSEQIPELRSLIDHVIQQLNATNAAAAPQG